MQLVYPTDEDMGYLSKRGAHFGKAKFYTIVTVVENAIRDVEVHVNPGHSGGAYRLEKSSGQGTCSTH